MLLAVLNYLVEKGACDVYRVGAVDPFDAVLNPSGIALVGQIVRQCREVEAQMRSLRIGVALDDEVYQGYRRTIDDLWLYVETYGIPALRREAACRKGHGAG